MRIKREQEAMITEMAQKDGVGASYQYLKVGWEKKPLQAHELAHLIGRLDYEQLGVRGITLCDANFAFGCYHGFFEVMLKEQGTTGVEVARQACIALTGDEIIQACLHGMGHGIMASKDSIPDSLTQCSLFPKDERFSCFDGIFMEYNMGIMEKRSSTTIPTQDDPWKFCEVTLKEARPACIRNQATYILASHALAQESTIHSCTTLPNEEKKMCISSVGYFAGDRRNGSADDIKNFCGALDASEDYSYCIFSAVSEMSFQSHHDHLVVMKNLCEGLNNIEWKTRCNKLLIQ